MDEDLEELLAQEMAFWAQPHPPAGDARFLGKYTKHRYLSTACFHGLHAQCRRTCKFCSTGCLCEDPDCLCCKTRKLWA